MPEKFILKDGEPVPCDDLMAWGKFLQDHENIQIADSKVGEVRVSTCFLGLDYSFGGEGPVLWETMVFKGPKDQLMRRCGGPRKRALEMHIEVLTEALGI